MSAKPIARKITRLTDGAHTGWEMSVEDYERAVKVIGDVFFRVQPNHGYVPASCARAALKAIGIVAPKKAKGAK